MFGKSGLNLKDARRRCYGPGGHVASFGSAAKYAEAIKAKRCSGVPLDNPEAAFAFWLDHPELF